MRFITNELFVGNKLTKGTIQTSDRRRIDLRNIRCPIVVLASWGDNITPPPQALNWIPDLYETDDAIRAHEQVIVYTLDQRIGHLGIFVSGKIAEKQHAEIVNTIDLISALPPGLYEMVIDDKQEPSDIGVDLLPGNYLVRFEGRSVADILALDDGREDERAFETVARISEINEGLYDTFVEPVGQDVDQRGHGRGAAHDAPAALRAPRDLGHEPDAVAAEGRGRGRARSTAGRQRPTIALRTTEKAVAQQIEQALDHYRDLRDRGQELAFKAIYNAPLVEALAGLRGAYADARKPRARDEHGERMLAGQDRGDQDARGAGRLHRGGAAHHAGGRQGRAHGGRARPAPRPADQAGASGAEQHLARAGAGRRQGGGLHAALRRGAGAGRAAASCCRARPSGARRSRSCARSAMPMA